MTVGELGALLSAGVGSWLLTGLVRGYALRRRILDHPGSRSLHAAPTPRGGGLAIVVIVLVAAGALGAAGQLPPGLAPAILGGGAAVALVGWWDDVAGVTPGVRAGVHLVAALWALWWLGGLPSLQVGTTSVSFGHWGWLLGALTIVWAVNLYNFMDGIDGLAGAETVCVGIGGGVLLLTTGARGQGLLSLVAGAAGAGFLLWNWAPARVFMGDVGSGFLGFLLGVMAVASERTGALPLLVWILLGGVFVVDATVTLNRRILRGEQWYAPHRAHGYQRLVQSGWSHAKVTVAAVLVNLLLFILAVSARFRAPLPWMLLAGLALLAGCYLLIERRAPMTPRSQPGS
ncbi:MAG TPA: glycosyltransferase family 4 protein [Gemmatimonadales bacterium]|nr:glycosyltransferase family 4 protein [Gemmatimonadales bacterium]